MSDRHPTTASQTARILALLRRRGAEGLTAADAYSIVGSMRLAARISDLRHEGYDISSEIVVTPSHKRVALYRLHEAAADTAEQLAWTA